jgi:hypothetical protein
MDTRVDTVISQVTYLVCEKVVNPQLSSVSLYCDSPFCAKSRHKCWLHEKPGALFGDRFREAYFIKEQPPCSIGRKAFSAGTVDSSL